MTKLHGRTSLAKACKLIPLSWPTAKKYVQEGKLRGIRIGGRWMVDYAEIERFRREGNYVEKAPEPIQPRPERPKGAGAFPIYLDQFANPEVRNLGYDDSDVEYDD